MLKPGDCRNCSLATISNGFSKAEGLCSLGVGILGESLGHNEYIDGLPFRPQGAAGSLLEQAFRILRVDRSQFLIDNIVRCQPPMDNLAGTRYEHSAIQYCHDRYGDRFLGDNRVSVILALGALSFRYITGLAGKKLGISDCRGYVKRSNVSDHLVVGSYHPAHIRRGKLAYTDYLISDLRKAIEVANGRYKSFGLAEEHKHNYQLNPSPEDARSYFYKVRDNGGLNLAYDIETPNSAEMEEDERDDIAHEEITSIQFSTGRGDGIWMPWEGNFIKVAKALLRTQNRKLCFNGWHFDDPKLEANGCGISGGSVDLMWKFHHFKPDLEMGLQKVASLFDWPFNWKHFASDPRMQRFYGCVDVEVLHWIEPRLEGLLGGMRVA